jgi:hypothetical protein
MKPPMSAAPGTRRCGPPRRPGRRWLAMLLCLALSLFGEPISAQGTAGAQFDPSDVYLQGYLASRSAEQAEESGNFTEALSKMRQAAELFGSVRKFYPDWKPEMVGPRWTATEKSLLRIQQKADGQYRRQRDAVAELEGASRPKPPTPSVRPAVRPPPKSVLDADPLAARRLKDAEAEVDRLRRESEAVVRKLRAENATRNTGLTKENEALRRQLATAEQTARSAALLGKTNEQLRAALAAAQAAAKRTKELEKTVTELRQQAGNSSEAAKDLQAQNEELRRQIALATTKDAELTRLNEKFRKDLKALETEAIALRKNGENDDSLQERLAAAQRAAESAEMLAAQNKALRQQLEAANSQSNLRDNANTVALRRQVAAAQTAADAAAAASARLSRLNEELRSRLNRSAEEQRKAEDRRLLAAGANTDLARRLDAAEQLVRHLRAKLAAAPLQTQLDELNGRIRSLEQERMAMARALKQSETAREQAVSRAAHLEQELAAARRERDASLTAQAGIQRDLDTERKTTNEVVKGQRKQIADLEKALAGKDAELAEATERIAGLARELQESRESFAALRKEHDALLLERDQMSALLKLNESGRIQDLIAQNMALARDMREAQERIDALTNEGSADKDTIAESLRDLAIAKSQINSLRRERSEQERRIRELEERLRSEEAALASGASGADPAEVELLRDLIRRQLRVQERQRQARDLLLAAARQLGSEDEKLAEAVEIFEGGDFELNHEEMKFVADRTVDGEFVSPFARDSATVSAATDQLNRDISVYERTAEKSFLAGRLLPTRELYEMILDQHPGHTPSLCKLGVVHLRLGEYPEAADSFRRAVELDRSNPYAHRMLGFSLMRLGDLAAAEPTLRRSVELSPDDPKNQMMLATVCYRLGKGREAESHFKAAINADPLPNEPYYNLALICSREGRIDDARGFYQQALERGAVPDPELEKRILRQ